MFKDILVPVIAGAVPDAAIQVACDIGEVSHGHVDALVTASMAWSNAAVWAYCPEGFHQTLEHAAATAVAVAAERVEARMGKEMVAHGVRRCSTIWLTTVEMTALCARYADLVVLGRSKAPDIGQRRVFGSVLAGSGRPVLLVPDGSMSVAGHAVIAWKASREATRALHDALPLLRRAGSVDLLLLAGDERTQEGDTDADANRVLAHLARHGVTASIVEREPGATSTGLRILEHARDSGASLIVAGGYSHSRAREHIFGGVTQTLFERASCPVLFSH